MIQFKNCYFWRATFSWDPVPSMFPEALALLQQSVVQGGGETSVWELGALNLALPQRKQFMGMGPSPVSRPVLHLAGECFNLASLMDTTKVSLPTLRRGSPSSMEGAGTRIWGCGAGKVLRQESLLYPVDIKAKDSLRNLSSKVMKWQANTFFMPSEDVLYVFYRPCSCISHKSLQPVALK